MNTTEFESLEIGDDVSGKQIFSLGYVSQWLQVPPKQLREIMRRNEIKFSMAINDIAYLDADGLLRINAIVKAERAAK